MNDYNTLIRQLLADYGTNVAAEHLTPMDRMRAVALLVINDKSVGRDILAELPENEVAAMMHCIAKYGRFDDERLRGILYSGMLNSDKVTALIQGDLDHHARGMRNDYAETV